MNKTKIGAEVVADSLDTRGNRLTSFLITMPRIILSEINTHRMLSKNTSSSRAIPFNKMVESVQNDPFIPIAWQREHKGMQGTEYWTEEDEVRIDIGNEFEYIEDIQPITEEFIKILNLFKGDFQNEQKIIKSCDYECIDCSICCTSICKPIR